MEEVNSAPGASIYVIGFTYQGYKYHWSTNYHNFQCPLTFDTFDIPPANSVNWIFSRTDPEEGENNETD